MKEIGYRIFALIYTICRLFPIHKNRCFLIMTHDAGAEGNVGVVREYLKKSGNYEFCHLIRSDTCFRGDGRIQKLLRFFIVKPYEMATSSYIFLDNIFLPIAYLRFSSRTKVVQLWHGTGTIKKFGQDVNTGRLKELENRANQAMTHLIVNSIYTKELYQHVFAVEEKKVFLLGMPRTDLLFDEKAGEERREAFFREYPQLVGKKLILYAPTFRDQDTEHPELVLDIDQVMGEIGKEYCLLLRLHPFVARNLVYEGEYADCVFDFSLYDNLNTLLFAADILISDYSSIVFEYCVLDRPMIFYAYDLEAFSEDGRGFYEPYEEYVPGPVVRNEAQMIEAIQHGDHFKEKRRLFLKMAYTYTDGQSTKRLIETVMGGNA